MPMRTGVEPSSSPTKVWYVRPVPNSSIRTSSILITGMTDHSFRVVGIRSVSKIHRTHVLSLGSINQVSSTSPQRALRLRFCFGVDCRTSAYRPSRLVLMAFGCYRAAEFGGQRQRCCKPAPAWPRPSRPLRRPSSAAALNGSRIASAGADRSGTTRQSCRVGFGRGLSNHTGVSIDTVWPRRWRG